MRRRPLSSHHILRRQKLSERDVFVRLHRMSSLSSRLQRLRVAESLRPMSHRILLVRQRAVSNRMFGRAEAGPRRTLHALSFELQNVREHFRFRFLHGLQRRQAVGQRILSRKLSRRILSRSRQLSAMPHFLPDLFRTWNDELSVLQTWLDIERDLSFLSDRSIFRFVDRKMSRLLQRLPHLLGTSEQRLRHLSKSLLGEKTFETFHFSAVTLQFVCINVCLANEI